MIKVYLGLANPSLEISLRSVWFMHGLILAKQWAADAQSYKYRDLWFGFEACQSLVWGEVFLFTYHPTLGRTVVLGTPLELEGERTHPSYHREPEQKTYQMTSKNCENTLKRKLSFWI